MKEGDFLGEGIWWGADRQLKLPAKIVRPPGEYNRREHRPEGRCHRVRRRVVNLAQADSPELAKRVHGVVSRAGRTKKIANRGWRACRVIVRTASIVLGCPFTSFGFVRHGAGGLGVRGGIAWSSPRRRRVTERIGRGGLGWTLVGGTGLAPNCEHGSTNHGGTVIGGTV
jgi:hypothetical protein